MGKKNNSIYTKQYNFKKLITTVIPKRARTLYLDFLKYINYILNAHHYGSDLSKMLSSRPHPVAKLPLTVFHFPLSSPLPPRKCRPNLYGIARKFCWLSAPSDHMILSSERLDLSCSVASLFSTVDEHQTSNCETSSSHSSDLKTSSCIWRTLIHGLLHFVCVS